MHFGGGIYTPTFFTAVLCGIYTPPPFFTAVLWDLVSFILDKPDVPLFIVGDFNGIQDTTADRHPPSLQNLPPRGTALSRFLGEMGWSDLWHLWNPDVKLFSRFYKTHGVLSRIDLCVGSPQAVSLASRTQYDLRGISDHSPLILWIAQSWWGLHGV